MALWALLALWASAAGAAPVVGPLADLERGEAPEYSSTQGAVGLGAWGDVDIVLRKETGEVWRTDGTVEGSWRLHSFGGTALAAQPERLCGASEHGVWCTQGEPDEAWWVHQDSATSVLGIVAEGAWLYFGTRPQEAPLSATPAVLWRSEGGPMDAQPLLEVAPEPPGGSGSMCAAQQGGEVVIALGAYDGPGYPEARAVLVARGGAAQPIDLGALTGVEGARATCPVALGDRIWFGAVSPVGAPPLSQLWSVDVDGQTELHVEELGLPQHSLFRRSAGARWAPLWYSGETKLHWIDAAGVVHSEPHGGGKLPPLEWFDTALCIGHQGDGGACTLDLSNDGFVAWVRRQGGGVALRFDAQGVLTGEAVRPGHALPDEALVVLSPTYTWLDAGGALLPSFAPGGWDSAAKRRAMALLRVDGTEVGTFEVAPPEPGMRWDGPTYSYSPVSLRPFRQPVARRPRIVGTGPAAWAPPWGCSGGVCSSPAEQVMLTRLGGGQTEARLLLPGAGPNPGSLASEAVSAGDRILVSARAHPWGHELFVTDGARANTTLLADLWPGGSPPNDGHPRHLVAEGDRAWFVADTPHSGPLGPGARVWVQDGAAAAPQMLPGQLYFSPRQLTPHGDSLYFLDSLAGVSADSFSWLAVAELGGDEVTALLPTSGLGVEAGVPHMVRSGSWVYAALRPAAGGSDALYRVAPPEHTPEPIALPPLPQLDLGPADGATLRVEALAPVAEGALVAACWAVGVEATGPCALIRLGEAAEPVVAAWAPLASGAPLAGVRRPAAGEGGVLFDGWTAAHGWEPWWTDGTEAGTHLILDLEPGPVGSRDDSALLAASPTPSGWALAAWREDVGLEPWRTSGAPGDLVLLGDLWPGAGGSEPLHLRALGDALYLTARTPDEGRELWRTLAGGAPQMVPPTRPGPDDSVRADAPAPLPVTSGALYFAQHPLLGDEPHLLCDGCLIEGRCWAAGEASPHNPCRVCDPALPTELASATAAPCPQAAVALAPTAVEAGQRQAFEVRGAAFGPQTEVHWPGVVVEDVRVLGPDRLRFAARAPASPGSQTLTLSFGGGLGAASMPLEVIATGACLLGQCGACEQDLDCVDQDPCTVDACVPLEHALGDASPRGCVHVVRYSCCDRLPTGQCGTCAGGGDLDGSGKLDVVDVQCGILTALWYLAGPVGAPPPCQGAPLAWLDLDCNHALTVGDVQLQVGLILGLGLPLPIDADQDGCADACPPP